MSPGDMVMVSDFAMSLHRRARGVVVKIGSEDVMPVVVFLDGQFLRFDSCELTLVIRHISDTHQDCTQPTAVPTSTR